MEWGAFDLAFLIDAGSDDEKIMAAKRDLLECSRLDNRKKKLQFIR